MPSNELFHILLTNMWGEPVCIQKRMIVAHETDRPAFVIATAAAQLDTNSK